MADVETDVTQNGGDPTDNQPAWLSSVPENLRNHEAFKGIDNASDVYQKFVDLTVTSKDSVQIPGEGATDEDRAAFYNALGRPESADKYTFSKPDNLPDSLQYDDAVEQHFKGVFHKLGLPDKAAADLWSEYHNIAVQGFEAELKAEADATDAALNELKAEWKGDAFKANTELAHRAFTKIFDNAEEQEVARQFLVDSKANGVSLGDHPIFLKMFHKIASVIGDDSLNLGRGNGVTGVASEEDAARKRFPNTKF